MYTFLSGSLGSYTDPANYALPINSFPLLDYDCSYKKNNESRSIALEFYLEEKTWEEKERLGWFWG